MLDKNVLNKALELISEAFTITELELLKVSYLGKKGIYSNLFEKLKNLEASLYLTEYTVLNESKKEFLNIYNKKKKHLRMSSFNTSTIDTFDLTLPGRGLGLGSLHPITNIIDKIERFFISMGFDIVCGLEIEDSYHNFDALNIRSNHPARYSSDTFYVRNNLLLRTHTSPVQVRVMENNEPPFRLITIGKVYRVDSDTTHTPMFHQVEVLVVDYDVNFTYLRWVLTKFLNFFFPDVVVRFRSSYFPFTEPSAEVDVCCFKCVGSGCSLCSFTGWLELLGCGMVQPIVLDSCGINYEKYSGFAFGVGIDRLAMLYYGISDLRLNFDNDIRFLNQF